MLYLLFIRLREGVVVRSKAKTFALEKGLYLYIGSAPNPHRVIRHLGKKKKAHWHIDYLLEKGEVEAIHLLHGEEEREALRLQAFLEPVEGFGSSDSKARAHLFRL